MNVVACVNDVFFFVQTQRQFLLFIHSYCHHLDGSFMVELGTRTPTTNTNQQHNDVFLYIRKTTFYSSFMDVFNNIGDHSNIKTIRLWLPVSMMSFSHFYVLTQRQVLLFIHSYCHHFGGSFMVELHFYSGHYWGKKPTPTTTNQQHKDVFLYI
jgi:hypothetical protein